MSPADAASFRDALARFASGVTVLTARGADGADHGMTVSAFSSLSLHPPLVLACLDTAATLLPPLRTAGWFGASILARGQEAVSARFADQALMRFEGVPCTRAAEGPALLDGALAHLVCRVVAVHEGGDHVIVVGEVRHAVSHDGEPLIYFKRRYAGLTRADDA